MDKSWISESNRLSHKFLHGISSFIDFARNSYKDGILACPCRRCVNGHRHSENVVITHILENGFSPGYTNWCFHGESMSRYENENSNIQDVNEQRNDNAQGQNNVQQFLEEMAIGYGQIRDLGSDADINGEDYHTSADPEIPTTEALNEEAKKFYDFLKQTDEELFPGCKKHSKLSFILQIFHMKCLNGWSNKSFQELLHLLRETLPEGDKLPRSSYEVKKIIDALGLGYKTIDVCPNNCMLFWKTDGDKQKCTKCGANRYKEDETNDQSISTKKKKQKGVKVLRWFPLIPRLQRLFMCSKTASLMRWHFDERKDDGNLRHPADARMWKEFDARYTDFSKDPRNVRLGLASDGFNPFRSLSSTHSTWPVVLTIYNWPPWLCMKQSSFILSLLIPGPQSPGDKIDLFLQPLIEELNDLWIKGSETYDAHTKTRFKMQAALLWTINDFPGYGMLSGWSTKGKFGCPCCGFHTWSKWLRNEEYRTAPIRMSGSCVLNMLNSDSSTIDLNGNVQGISEACKRKSIFFCLPYWEYNLVRHNLDTMHIEKNVCDNILGTLLDIDGKSKDNLKARLDLQEMGIRSDLHPIEVSTGKFLMPAACYTMSRPEKDQLLSVLKEVKVPDSYSSNISSCVNTKTRKLIGLKSHDCHVLLHDLLHVALRGCLPDKVSKAIIDLSTYFREVCSKVLRVSRLEELEIQIGETLSCMEMIFPPSFFTIMVHLVTHLAEEAKLAGPIHYRWMYPIERYLMTLKAHVTNRAHPEASIAEWNIANESIEYCSRYFEDVETRFNRPARNNDEMDHVSMTDAPINMISGRSIGKVSNVTLDEKTIIQAHRYVLYNSDVVQPFIEEHRDSIRRGYRSKNRKRSRDPLEIEKTHHLKFVEWFRNRVSMLVEMQDPRATEHVKWLARGPNKVATQFNGYIIKGIRYRTKKRDAKRKTQNSGVVITSKTSHSDDDTIYYGRLVDMIELNYYERFRVVLFKCEWVDVERGKGVKTDKFGYTLVNFSKLVHTGSQLGDEPFVLAAQVEPVFYIKDSQQSQWFVALRTKPRDTYEMGDELSPDQHNDISNQLPPAEADEEENWNRSDVPGVTVEHTDAAVAITMSDEEV
ncbi:hypothetical protein LINPERPRIM_LOCUS17158 [Linum perenne]